MAPSAWVAAMSSAMAGSLASSGPVAADGDWAVAPMPARGTSIAAPSSAARDLVARNGRSFLPSSA